MAATQGVDQTRRSALRFIVPATIALITLAVYAQVVRHEFINYDDELFVTDEPMVQAGLTWRGIVWAFTDISASNWFPLTRISHMIDCELFGVRPGPHLFVNVLFHIANTLLLFRVFHRMTAALGPSAFVAAAFALHPLHVESVAWVSERRDLLSTFWALVTIGLYVTYTAKPRASLYAAALITFALALMSKSMVVTLPCILLLLDHWPLGRYLSIRVRTIVLEKLPFFALSAVVSIITVYAQGQGDAIASTEQYPLTRRVANAIIAYGLYLQKTFFPIDLAIFYPYPEEPYSFLSVALCAALLAAVSFAAVLLIRRAPYVFTGWFWFIGMLVPVIGLVQVGNQAMADRYTYLSLTGIFVVVGWGAKSLAGESANLRTAFVAIGCLAVAAMTALTAVQLTHWKTSEWLFRHAIDATGGSSKAHNNLGTALFEQARYAEAEAEFRLALEFGPGNIQARNNLGAALLALGQPAEALPYFEQVLEVNPDDASVHLNAAVALMDLGRRAEALERARLAQRLDPTYAPAATFLRDHSDR